MPQINTLKDVFIDHIRDLYDAEKQLVKALPKIIKAADSEELKNAVSDHLDQTKHHVERLEQVFASFDEKARGKSCKAMKGLIEEGGESTEDEGALADLAIIAAAQKVEHYEISAYGTAKAWAEQLGNEDVVSLLSQTEEEERAADSKLTAITMQILQNVPERGEAEEELEEA